MNIPKRSPKNLLNAKNAKGAKVERRRRRSEITRRVAGIFYFAISAILVFKICPHHRSPHLKAPCTDSIQLENGHEMTKHTRLLPLT
jgi:hypothetical protein